jgi:hypothetical protein
MARTRFIKPVFFRDSTLAECSPEARLLFIGAWCFADDAGGLDRSAKDLKAQVFPHDKLNVEPLIQELLKAGLLVEYEAGGKKYLHIKNFRGFQRIDRPSPPRVPLYEDSSSMSRVLDEDSSRTQRALVEDSASPRRGLVESDASYSSSSLNSSASADSPSTSESMKNKIKNPGSKSVGRREEGSAEGRGEDSTRTRRGLVEDSSNQPQKVAETTEAEWRREAQEAMDRIQRIYPAGSNSSNWTVALHHASCLVGDGFATWAELVDAVERYRCYQEANGQAMNIAAHNFFDPRKQHWTLSWEIRTEADVRREANIAAAQRVFDRLPEEP